MKFGAYLEEVLRGSSKKTPEILSKFIHILTR